MLGLPLAIAFADRGLKVGIYDLNPAAVEMVQSGVMPFDEPGAEEVLKRVVADSRLKPSTDASIVSRAEHVVVVIGTPVDEHLNPDPKVVPAAVEDLAAHLRSGQLLVLRSTVYPGVTALVERRLAKIGVEVDVAFCPERIAEGKALQELFELPQIVSARNPAAVMRARKLFEVLVNEIVELQPEEAELAKLYTNAVPVPEVRTGQPAVHDGQRLRIGLRADPPGRDLQLPPSGRLAGGRLRRRACLLKDTMQLAAFNNNNFVLGHAAMMVNEGLPLYLVDRVSRKYDLTNMTVGILGMAFKGESDDTRSSLAYKLKRILRFKADNVLCTDPYVTVDRDPRPPRRGSGRLGFVDHRRAASPLRRPGD